MLDGRAERCALSVCGSDRVRRGEDSSDCHTATQRARAWRPCHDPERASDKGVLVLLHVPREIVFKNRAIFACCSRSRAYMIGPLMQSVGRWACSEVSERAAHRPQSVVPGPRIVGQGDVGNGTEDKMLQVCLHTVCRQHTRPPTVLSYYGAYYVLNGIMTLLGGPYYGIM
eukprot:5391950-Prymnesium_polylepis.1